LNTTRMGKIHDVLFPKYASRMRMEHEMFQENNIKAQCYPMDNSDQIEQQYKLIEEALRKLRMKEASSSCALTQILYARMKIEQLKVPTIIKEAKEELQKGKSVAIFVNFMDTLVTLSNELQTNCMIYGQQTVKQRDACVDAFQTDKERVILCNIKSGGVGISLHDTNGTYPRVSLVSPSWSAQDILQSLGRVHRANGKTPVTQKIIFCEGTIEEKVCQNMSSKIYNISQLNDGDMLSHQIDGLSDLLPTDPEKIIKDFRTMTI